ncbi:putative reverse transcriptase domain-containing protein [Tanacetum coccineum]|uniref:Reverse transcriptase domain-containing protein n=1 Tax=Tanacetum coccineum TaxID=301880 RepID=A0ABQ5J9J4_9ASTR
MADHSQKWHDGSSIRNRNSSSNTKGIIAIECPLTEEVKSIEEVKYGKFGRSSPFNNGAKYYVGPLGLNFYAMADLGASISVMLKFMFEHLKLANLKKTAMLVEMVDMTKKTPIGIVENVLVKIDKFLFPSDFVDIDMLNTRNETMILGIPFLATIHAEIDVFNKEISLGIGDDRVTFDMDKKIHNFTTLIGNVYMVWPTCAPTKKLCNEGNKIYGMDEQGVLKYWYGDTQGSDLIWDSRYAEWCSENSRHIDVSETVKKTLLKSWLIDCSREELVKDPQSRSFDDYKWMFNLEIDQLADEYELGIGKKGHILDDIWENCKKVQGDNTYWWHDHGLEENERQERGVDIEEYDPPEVHVETFEQQNGIRGHINSYSCGKNVSV